TGWADRVLAGGAQVQDREPSMRKSQTTRVVDEHALSVRAAMRQGPDEAFDGRRFHLLTVQLPDSGDSAHGSVADYHSHWSPATCRVRRCGTPGSPAGRGHWEMASGAGAASCEARAGSRSRSAIRRSR